MNSLIITVGSVTYAIKLRRLLLRGGVRSKLVKVEKGKNGDGCVHGVEINDNEFYKAVSIMRENNIDYTVLNK